MEEVKNILIELQDEELKLISKKELGEIEQSAEEFDGFTGIRIVGQVNLQVSLAASSSGAKSELLPCPFCGLPAKAEKVESAFNNRQRMWRIKCGGIGSECEIKPSTDLYRLKKDAIEHWHIRASL